MEPLTWSPQHRWPPPPQSKYIDQPMSPSTTIGSDWIVSATGLIHASTVRKHYAAWAGWAQGIVHDGERALWAPAAKRAYKEAGVPPLKHPPTSPDMNPIENAWALLDRRLEETRPETFEPENKFRARVHAATRYLNAGRRLPSLQRLVGGMRSRVKGAMTRY